MNACRLILDGILTGTLGAWTMPITVPLLAGWAAALTTADDEPEDRPETWSNGRATLVTPCSSQRCDNAATTELNGWHLCGRCYEELAAR